MHAVDLLLCCRCLVLAGVGLGSDGDGLGAGARTDAGSATASRQWGELEQPRTPLDSVSVRNIRPHEVHVVTRIYA